MAHDTSDEFPIIYRYTRQQALEDGVLVDVSEMAREVGFKIPVAMTNNAWADGVAWRGSDYEATRLRELLLAGMVAVMGENQEQASDTLLFTVHIVRLEDMLISKNPSRVPLELKLHIGGGDNGEPVLTILLPDED